MPMWGWIVIAVVVIAVVALAAWWMASQRRTKRLRSTFGPEYDRTVEGSERREAESELEARYKRRQELDIRPLTPQARQRYSQAWTQAQGRFVDQPSEAVREADVLVIDVMRERGYPMDTFEQRAADVSVDHPQVVENYRAAHDLSIASEQGRASTEDLRQAMVHYRALFEELLDTGGTYPQASGATSLH
jgi:hypothetical protein